MTFSEESNKLDSCRRLSYSNPNIVSESSDGTLIILEDEVSPESPKIPSNLSNTATALKLMELEDNIAALQMENNTLRSENDNLRSELEMIRNMRKRKIKPSAPASVKDAACDTGDLHSKVSTPAKRSTKSKKNLNPSKKNIDPKVNVEATNIKIIASSQGRGIAQIMGERITTKVTASVVPNGMMSDVLKCAGSKPTDALVIIAGGNDVRSGDAERPAQQLDEFLKETNANQVVVVGIPHRYNEISANYVDLPVFRANARLKELCSKLRNTTFIDVTDTTRLHFTKNGLHFNQKGKEFIAMKIALVLKTAITVSENQPPLQHLPDK